MASHKKQAEGIALLSIYGDDEDDEMEYIEEEESQPQSQNQQQSSTLTEEEHQQQLSQTLTSAQNDTVSATDYYYSHEETNINNEDDGSRVGDDSRTEFSEEQLQQQVKSDDFSSKAWNSGPSPQQQQTVVSVSVTESSWSRKETRLTIVDYGHDEMAMSPEPEEGEIMATGRVMYGEELQTANGDFQERTTSGTTQGPPPSSQATPPQSSEQNDLKHSDVVTYTVNESSLTEVEEVVMVTVEESNDLSPLDKFLPPPPREKCTEELQERIRKFLTFKRSGKSYNSEVRNRKEYRNPDFLLHAVTHLDIDQIGSCFSKDVFDPHGYDKSDFYDDIEMDMRREMERKEQERKRSPKVDFISGGTQPGTVVPTPKINIPIPGVNSVSMDFVARDGRQNKKSKWDKVDGDQKNHMSTGGHDNLSAVAANSALLSAANAGAGYSAFAQQRRREAEDKRSSSDKKLDRRS